ncbi:MAG TPA: MBL fold metallo-hydrolase, partial [Panacibacter sp.]|nr:MBL fold metallo-hydrolase [Panacibacter sp.]
MCLYIASLNSGSNGNCYYAGNDTEAVLIDAGISCRETEKRMKRCGLSMKNVKAIFISHEHSDHISGVTVLSKKYQLPVYITPATLKSSGLPIEPHLVNAFTPGEPITINNISVTAFTKQHDADDPHSFIVACKAVTVGIFTDVGIVCEELVRHFKLCNAAFLEANYDEVMLSTGNYPYHLKKRISGGMGHLSNTQAVALFNAHRSPGLSHLILAHLSKNNNSPQIVQELFNSYAGNTEIIVASRYVQTD